jgi:hypothetical protein
MNSAEAKQFLISRVIQEAELENISLTQVERKMLEFTESQQTTIPDIYELNAQFERDYNADEYEAKIAGLLRRARNHDNQETDGQKQQWADALTALSREDHYLLVMVRQAFGTASTGPGGAPHRLRDFLLYVAIAVGLVVTLFLVSVYRQ